MWSIVIILSTSRLVAAWLDPRSPPMQKFRGLQIVSDPIVIIVTLSLGFGGMIAGVASLSYGGVLLVMTLLSLSVCREPSFLLRTYCISIAMLVGLASVVEFSGKSLVLLSALIPFAGALVIKGCQWMGAKIEW
jgi:hypothetical protein